jgi:2-oxoglutarate ferredoxin oxidoreductase subunit beta
MSAETFASYLDETLFPYPFCPGCGHGSVLDSLNAALVKLQLDPHQVVIITDIGCAGLSDKYFTTNGFHGLHGRSVTYATGIKLANPDLKVIVLIGDGGCGIGGHHLINAARRNIGVTTLVFNNFNYGMTGGEHSVTTLPGARTASTPFGNLEQPMDICATVAVNGAGWVARATSFDKNLSSLIAQAIAYDGFALIDIWELCAAYYVPNNRFSRKLLEEALRSQGFSTGVLHDRERPEYSRLYRLAVADQSGLPILPAEPLVAKYTSSLEARQDGVIAGAAGMRIASAAAAFCRGALLSGLWAAQRNDYPVTVRTGYSISEVALSPQPVRFPGLLRPSWVAALFPEGLKQVRALLPRLDESTTLYIESGLQPVETRARLVPLHLSRVAKKKAWSLAALADILHHTGVYPVEALVEAVSMQGAFAEENLAAIQAGLGRVITD